MNIANRADWWEEMCSPQAKALWAKSGDERAHLSLPQHLIDAACVAQWLWDNWVCDVLKATLARLWCLNESEVRTLYCFYAGTHDVGKATVTFQRQIENRPDAAWLLPPLEQAGLSLDWPRGEGSNVSFPHGTASGLLLRKWLEEQGICKFLRVVLSAVPDAHHGFTSNPMTLRLREDGIKKRETQFDTIAFQLLDGMAEITAIAPVLERLQDSGEVPTAPALQLMTGMVVMADWIASNEDAFPYEPVLPQVERVSRAMDYIQLPAPWRPQDISDDLPELFRKTFAWGTDITLRPVQRAAVEAAMDASDPTLMIIEAPTGEGKTEAGLAAAHVLGEKFGSQGVFLAAPTMATANGLFERATQWAQHSSRGGQVASMFLAHSKNQLSKPYQELRYSGIGIDQPGEDDTPSVLNVDLVAVEYGPQSSSVASTYAAQMGMPLVLLLEQSGQLRQAVRDAASVTSEAAIGLGRFAANLLVAAGKEYEFTPAPTDQVLAELEPLFNAWLQNLANFVSEIVSGNGDDTENDIVRLVQDWQSKVREIIVSQALILLRGAGPKAMVGKIVTDSNGEGTKKVVSAGTYYQKLQRYLDQVLPLTSKQYKNEIEQERKVNHE